MLSAVEPGCQKVSRLPKADSDLGGGYEASSRSRKLDNTKEWERKRVANHILNNLPDNNLLIQTNPGIHYHFERILENELGEYNAKFIGLERSWSNLEFGLQYMPGKTKQRFQFSDATSEVSGFLSNKGAIIHCELEAFPYVTKFFTDSKTERWGIKRWNRLIHPNAFWIDLYGTLLRPQFARVLRDLTTRLELSTQSPYAITGIYGRDNTTLINDSGLQARADGIASELSQNGLKAETTDVWHYYGHNNARMMTVCGVIRKLQSATPEAIV